MPPAPMPPSPLPPSPLPPSPLPPSPLMGAQLLLLADSRLPAGGHAHSGGLAAAVVATTVSTQAHLEQFLRGRATTVGLVAAAVAAHACQLALTQAPRQLWEVLDSEVDARMPSAAARAASRAQGRSLARLGRVAWGTDMGREPHHSVALGCLVATAGGSPHDAALLAASASVTGPASAAVRLLSLDPLAVTELQVRLAATVDAVAEQAAASATSPAAHLPGCGAPMLDQLAETHVRAAVRLFAS